MKATPISNRPSFLQNEIISFIFGYKAKTGQLPTVRVLSEEFQSGNIRYHLNRMADRGFLERSVANEILHLGRKLVDEAKDANCYQMAHQGKVKRGCCPERARQIVTLLHTDSHAVDRFARLFSQEWRKGVAL